MYYLNRGTRNVEPLVNGAVNRGIRLRSGSGDGRLGGSRIAEGSVGNGHALGVDLAADKAVPRLLALLDDIEGVGLVLGLAAERELVLGLAVGDLVDAEPLVRGTEQAREVALDVLDVVHLGGVGVLDVDGDDLPVGLAIVEQGHHTENLDLLDLTSVANSLTDLANVEGIVVTNSLRVGVLVVRVLPGLGERTVVPDVALVGEAVAHKPQLTLLGVLKNRVEAVLLVDLELGVRPTRDLNHHVQNGLLRVSVQRDVVERRHDLACLVLEIDLVVQGVLGADLMQRVVAHDVRGIVRRGS